MTRAPVEHFRRGRRLARPHSYHALHEAIWITHCVKERTVSEGENYSEEVGDGASLSQVSGDAARTKDPTLIETDELTFVHVIPLSQLESTSPPDA